MRSIKLILPVLILLFCAFQCEEPPELDPTTSTLEKIVLSVNPNVSTVNIGDTIWLSGNVSSKVLEFATGDSIFLDETPNIFISFYRLKMPVNDRDYNTALAANEFDFYSQIGTLEKEDYSWSHTPEAHVHWDKLHRIVTSELSPEMSRYSVLIGVIPKNIGCFAFECMNTFKVNNFNRDLYAQFGDINDFSFFAQGRNSTFWAPIDDRLYFFKVESKD